MEGNRLERHYLPGGDGRHRPRAVRSGAGGRREPAAHDWNITLPGIRSTIIVLLIMSIGHLIRSGSRSNSCSGTTWSRNTRRCLDLYALNYGIGMGTLLVRYRDQHLQFRRQHDSALHRQRHLKRITKKASCKEELRVMSQTYGFMQDFAWRIASSMSSSI